MSAGKVRRRRAARRGRRGRRPGAAAPAASGAGAPAAAAATTPAAQPAETARTPTSQASSEQKPTSSKASKDTPSAASATDSAVLPADAAAAIARARAEANAPQQPFASAPIPPAPTPLGDEALRAAFEAADANSNGEVSIIEAIKALRANADFARALGLEPQHVKQEDGSRDKFIRAFGAFDGNGDKRLTFSEFRSGYRALVEEREKEEKQHRRSDLQERFANRLKFWGGSPGSSPPPSPVPASAREQRGPAPVVPDVGQPGLASSGVLLRRRRRVPRARRGLAAVVGTLRPARFSQIFGAVRPTTCRPGRARFGRRVLRKFGGHRAARS